MKKKPALSFWQIWNMSFGFLGIQFGFALQNANVSRIFESLGAKVDDIPILWIAAPVTGLIIQPIIGHMSDKTWGRFGRRRPYFMVGAILASLALLFMPNSPALWIAAGVLWIMDASINISMEPFRAFVGDMLPGKQRTAGFAMQSFFIGTGAVVASALPWVLTNWFNVSNEVMAGEKIPQSVKLSFYLGGAVFLLAVLWTVFSTKEYSPEQLSEFEAEKKQSSDTVEVPARTTKSLLPIFIKSGFVFLIIGILASLLIFQMGWEKELYVLSVGLGAFGLILLTSAWYTRQGLVHNGFVEVITDLMNMPKTMKQLAVTQFFSWFALFAMWIYSTSAVTSHIYGTSDSTSALYNEGANWVGILFATYNGFAAVVAFLLPVLAKWTSRKTAHAIALICGGIGLASFYVVKDPHMLLFSMLGVGIAWASILSMPYAILTGSLPAKKMGTYMGIFNFFIVIPQILAASILGFFTKIIFQGHAIYALILGGASLLIAALSVLFVDDVDQK
ncbi:MAG TPA: MFS transporter [Prolixibacteraceae bacterium]|nr:MFS transporter [Prolixibacteraceae bacterium]